MTKASLVPLAAIFACHGSHVLRGPGRTWPWAQRRNCRGSGKSAAAAECRWPSVVELLLCSASARYQNAKNGLFSSFLERSVVIYSCTLPVSSGWLCCRSEMATWCVCGSWLESAWLNTPPPSAPGPTARGYVGLFREELHASWSTATTRSLIFPPYLSQPIKPGAINGWLFFFFLYAEKTSKPSPNSCSGLMRRLGDFLWLCGHPCTAPPIFLTDVHLWWWISLRKSSNVISFPQVFFSPPLSH